MKKRAILLGLIVALISIVLLYLLANKDDEYLKNPSNPRPLPIPDIKEYIEEFNEGLKKSQIKRKEKEKNKTPEMIATEKTFWEKVISQSKATIQDITFYGKVIDQHGDPVSGAIVTYIGQGEVFARGSGTQYTETDDNGIFITMDMQGAAFVVERIEKEGYQSTPRERFLNNYGHPRKGLLWEKYSTIENPFVFKAWKVAESGYPNVRKSQGRYGFKPGTTYSLDFTAKHKSVVKKEGRLDLDLQVTFKKDTDESWTLVLKVPNGGLLETEDLYMNLAPETGYHQELAFSGTLQEYKKNRQLIRAMKKYYIHSRGQLYGSLEIGIRPYSKPSGSALKIKHIMSLDGGRNLESK